ncbi:galactokinase [Corynebacterium epidermidicanis]|nr:galactokinase [Corynebacterium epidermidicanis]
MTQWINTRTPEELDRDARQLFDDHFGTKPAGVWAAPGRVNVIGDHVDYAGGVSIPFALTQMTALAVRLRSDQRVRIISQAPGAIDPLSFEMELSEVGPKHPDNWAGYVVGVLWAGQQSGIWPNCPGMDIAIVSDVPVGSGLSSSAALECAIAVAAFELTHGHAPSQEERGQLVPVCMRAENDVVGASTGGLDQRASLFGVAGKALVIDFHADTVTLVPFDLAAQDMVLLVADTNAPHALNDGQYASRRGIIDEVSLALVGEGKTLREIAAEQALSQADAWAIEQGLDASIVRRRLQHVVEETQRTLKAAEALQDADMAAFRQYMQESHESLRDLYEVVTEELESAFQAAGRFGARMTGGGFGGSVIVLLPESEVEDTVAQISRAAADAGFPECSFLLAVPGDGARRLS